MERLESYSFFSFLSWLNGNMATLANSIRLNGNYIDMIDDPEGLKITFGTQDKKYRLYFQVNKGLEAIYINQVIDGNWGEQKKIFP